MTTKKNFGFRLTDDEIRLLESLDPTGQRMAINGLRFLLIREENKQAKEEK